jgi:hypothetical protein
MKILFLSLIIFTNLIAKTSVYKCVDMKDESFEMYFNIDTDSLHYRKFVFNYTSTVKEKNNLLVHFFSHKNIHYTVTQEKNSPKMIYIDDFKNNKLRYQYKCFYTQMIISTGENEIPITWKNY